MLSLKHLNEVSSLIDDFHKQNPIVASALKTDFTEAKLYLDHSALKSFRQKVGHLYRASKGLQSDPNTKNLGEKMEESLWLFAKQKI